MKKACFYYLSFSVFLITAVAQADEVLRATSEDLKEFDRILIQAQSKKNSEPKKTADPIPEKKQISLLNPRENFQHNVSQDGKRLRAVRPFDHRPPPGAFTPGDNLMAPPPPPAPPKEAAPPSPPH